MARSGFLLAATCAAMSAVVAACGQPAHVPPRLAPVDVLVFAPHPDDEVIGTGGVIQQALAEGKQVRIVFMTNGDAHALAASALTGKPIAELAPGDYLRLAVERQRDAIAADRLLGLGPANIVFLGYPDGILGGVYADLDSAAVRSPATGRTETYGPVVPDFHSLAHFQPAPYTKVAAVADVEEILRSSRPGQIYVTDGADQHPDHRAAFLLVRDAIAATGYGGELRTFIAHSGRTQQWPWPRGATPREPFSAHRVAGGTLPAGVPWPPPVRISMTPAEAAVKLLAVEAHSAEWALPTDQAYLTSFVKAEEIFWTGAPGT